MGKILVYAGGKAPQITEEFKGKIIAEYANSEDDEIVFVDENDVEVLKTTVGSLHAFIKPPYMEPPYAEPFIFQNPYKDFNLYEDVTKKQMSEVVVPVRTEEKIQRNSPRPCGSGKKYKHCCINKN